MMTKNYSQSALQNLIIQRVIPNNYWKSIQEPLSFRNFLLRNRGMY